MRTKRALARVFFVGSLATMLITVFQVPVVQATESEEDEAVKCADGNRKMCESGPLPGGGTYYKYYV